MPSNEAAAWKQHKRAAAKPHASSAYKHRSSATTTTKNKSIPKGNKIAAWRSIQLRGGCCSVDIEGLLSEHVYGVRSADGGPTI